LFLLFFFCVPSLLIFSCSVLVLRSFLLSSRVFTTCRPTSSSDYASVPLVFSLLLLPQLLLLLLLLRFSLHIVQLFVPRRLFVFLPVSPQLLRVSSWTRSHFLSKSELIVKI
jgi:hypothetical protein